MSVYRSEKSLHANVIITCATDDFIRYFESRVKKFYVEKNLLLQSYFNINIRIVSKLIIRYYHPYSLFNLFQ